MDISFKLELHAVTVLWTERYNSNEFQCQLQENVLQNKETLQNSTRCSVIAALPLWLTLTSSMAANIKHVTQFIVTNRRNTASNINLNCTFHTKVYYCMKSQYNFQLKTDNLLTSLPSFTNKYFIKLSSATATDLLLTNSSMENLVVINLQFPI